MLSATSCAPRFAELSQLALRIRQDVDKGHGDIAELRTSRNLKYRRFLSCDLSDAGANLLLLTKNIFDFASLQYYSTLIYLHTSMYHGQQMDARHLQHKDIPLHCRLALARASLIISSRATAQNHVIFRVFLAGVASSNDRIVQSQPSSNPLQSAWWRRVTRANELG